MKIYISNIILQNFRNHSSYQLENIESSVILIGKNGVGKTNLLEAISLLASGRGMRSASLIDIQKTDIIAPNWSIFSTINNAGEEIKIGTGLKINNDNHKRIIKINGEQQKSATILDKYFAVNWVTPAMGLMFLEGESTKRNFLDRLATAFNKDHNSHLRAYSHIVRERNHLLAIGEQNIWLSNIEKKISSYAIAIAATRNHCVNYLNQISAKYCISSFPRARLEITGEAENMLANGLPANAAEDILLELLAKSRLQDAEKFRTSIGTHHSKLHIYYDEKESSSCSTGEQKALLLSIIMTHVRARSIWNDKPPIILLDEVIAHLDITRRRDLFTEMEILSVQAWLSGTDAGDFRDAKNIANIVKM